MNPPQCQLLPGNLIQCGLFSPQLCKPLPEACSNTGSQPPLRVPLLPCGCPSGAAGRSLHPHGPAGAQLLYHGLSHRLQGDLLLICPSFSTDFGIYIVVPFTYSYFALLWPQLALCNNFFYYFRFLKYVIMEESPPFLIVPVLASDTSILEPAGGVLAGHGGSFWQRLTEAALQPCPYQNLAMQNQYTCLVPSDARSLLMV